MKFVTKARMTVLSKESNVSESTGKESYKIAVMQGSEAGSISCVKGVFEQVKPLESVIMEFLYDDKYNYMRVTDVDMASSKPAFGK